MRKRLGKTFAQRIQRNKKKLVCCFNFFHLIIAPVVVLDPLYYNVIILSPREMKGILDTFSYS